MYVLAIGFLVGIRHAFDADHLAAVTTLIVRSPSRRESVRIGVAWGAGHALMLLAASLAVLLYGQADHERFAPIFEGLVGVVLIGLGLDVIRRAYRQKLHIHGHRHGEGVRHYHFHAHREGVDHRHDRHEHVHAAPGTLRAVLVGLVHGLAGSAALLVLSVGATASAAAALVYVCAFGLGSMLGMAAISLTVAWPLRLCADANPRWLTVLSVTAGVGSVALGSFVLAEMLWLEHVLS